MINYIIHYIRLNTVLQIFKHKEIKNIRNNILLTETGNFA